VAAVGCDIKAAPGSGGGAALMDWIEAERISRGWRLGNAEADIADSAERALAGRGPVTV